MKNICIAIIFCLILPLKIQAVPPQNFLFSYDRPLDSLNIFTQTGYVFTDFTFLVFDRLVHENPQTGELVPSLAESWQIAKDKRSAVFRLRKNAKFHDGKPVTAEDVKFSWDAHNDPRYKSILTTSASKTVKVEVVDSHPVRVTLPHASVSLFLSVGFWLSILPKHYYGDLANEPEWRKTVVGSGPYKVVGFSTSKKIDFEKHSAWWGFQDKSNRERYRFPFISMRFTTDLLVATEMLKRGELHYVRYFEPTDFKKYLGSGDTGEAIAVKSNDYRANGERTLGLNNRLPFFSDVKVRQALLMLFPREEINQKLFHGLLSAAAGTTNQKNLHADPSLKPMPYDPAKSLQLLREAGWGDEDKNGILEKIV